MLIRNSSVALEFVGNTHGIIIYCAKSQNKYKYGVGNISLYAKKNHEVFTIKLRLLLNLIVILKIFLYRIITVNISALFIPPKGALVYLA